MVEQISCILLEVKEKGSLPRSRDTVVYIAKRLLV